jgi:hypothetical protein
MNLLRVLKCRSTAWEKDRFIIALLMAGWHQGYDVESSLIGPEIIKNLTMRHRIQRDAISTVKLR